VVALTKSIVAQQWNRIEDIAQTLLKHGELDEPGIKAALASARES